MGSREQILLDAMAGDQPALDALWADHRRWVAAVLRAQRPDASDLEDLLQEVAVTLVQNLGKLRDPAAFRGWLRAIAVHAAHSAARKRAVRTPGGPMPPGGGVDPRQLGAGAHAEDRDEVDATMRRVGELPEELREPLMLRAERGLSQREIAEILGVPVTTVETRLARARRLLRASVNVATSTGPRKVLP